MGAIGRYVFNPELFDCLKKTEPGIGNEIQLTDGIRLLKELQDVYAYRIEGKRYDTGDVTGYIRAIIELGLDDENVRADILKHLHLVYERESP
jgi:UTP--glucose-1-phosphate uridylyltransferase